MTSIYFTIAGTQFYHGKEFFEPKMRVKLVKEHDNEHDTEAIVVRMPGLGDVGHVANSPHTVLGESFSAGRLYDKIGEEATGTVLYVLERGVLCQLDEKCILPEIVLVDCSGIEMDSEEDFDSDSNPEEIPFD